MTWINHFTTGSPTWTVDPTWLQRVSDVVDAVIERNLYAIVNVHHDATDWADLTASGANYTMIEEKFYQLWYQIGTKLACKSPLLAFEPINEPPGATTEQFEELNKLQGLFIKALSGSGGFNAQRVVTLVGPSENGDLTDQYFKPPPNMTNPYAIQYHYYSPYDFIFGAWGKTIWGSDADEQSMDTDLSIVRGNFTTTPIVIGEWSATTSYTETAARWKYFDHFIRTASKYNTMTMLWDNGADHLDRQAHTWRDQTEINILMNATAGTTNSLADSTEDPNAISQESSAYLFLDASTNAIDVSLPYLFNGNTIQSISSPNGNLQEGTDYAIDGNNITYKASFLSPYQSSLDPGIKANLTLSFYSGSSLALQIIQYATPTLSSNTTAASSVSSGSDLRIPITWAGIPEVAAVQATLADGTFLVDSWTQYLGPLQQGRMTYSSQYNWDAESVTITASAVQAVVAAAGQTCTFKFEFYPRIPGNSVNYTITV